MPRDIITFQCTECKNRNYTSTKNKKTTTERLEMKKFCRHCRKHQAHKEIKENRSAPLNGGVRHRGVGLTADQRSPKPRVGVRIPPPLPTPRIQLGGRGKDNSMAADVKVWFQDTKEYFDGLKLEMRRVTWPNRKQVEGTTAVVILSVFAFAAYFAVVDSILTRGVKAVLDFFTK